MLSYILLAVIFSVIAGPIIYFIARHFVKQALYRSIGSSLFLIQIPREDLPGGAQPADAFKAGINKFEQLLSGLSAIKQPFALEVAVPHVGEEIHFYLSVPKKFSEVAKKQVQGLWSGASVDAAPDDFNVFNPHGVAVAAYLRQKEKFALPMRTYEELGLDSFSSILTGFTRVNAVGEGAALQLIVKPALSNAKQRVQGYIEALKKGEPVKQAFGHDSPFSVSEMSHALRPEKEEKEKKERVVDDEAVKALQMKISKPLFEVNARIIASAASQFQAEDILEGLGAGFEQFAAPLRNAYRLVKPKNPKGLLHKFIFRMFDGGETMILSSAEVASFYHFPIPSTETPRVKWLKAKEAPPPADLPEDGVLVGESVFRGQRKPIYVTDDDRRRHVYVIGQTGTGKSTLMANMVVDDIRKGRGVAMIDPHGDLVEKALGLIPKNRIDDVIYFDPGDLSRPLGLNMLEYNFNRPEEKTFIVNEMQGIFNRLFSQETMGPMFEQYMRNALLLLMEDMPNEPATLVEVPRIFTDTKFRMRKLERIHNPIVIDFWEKEAVKAGGEASLANMTPYITSKFNNFISNDYMRPIIGQAKSAFNFREAMDGGKILLINLSKGRIGDINAGLLGMVMSGKILMAALSRVDIPDVERRRDFNMYIDEFQNFTTDSISTILSEARKYRLNLTMAHQFIGQLDDKIKDAVFGNVGSQIVFRVGVQDAEFLVKQFEPTFNQNDLINIDNYNAYAKILVRGQTSKPFNMRTLMPEQGSSELTAKLKEYSRVRYGMDRQEIEEEIYRRLRE